MACPRWTASLTLVALVGLLVVAVPANAAAQDSTFAGECDLVTGVPVLRVGVVDCLRVPSEAMGSPVPFGYYIPPGCDPELGRECPVLYYIHGTSGSYRSGVGAKGSAGSPWVRALSAGPSVDPYAVSDPWNHGPGTWAAQPPLDMIIVSPHGLTVPDGHGPIEHADTGWSDWNPRYAQGGDSQRYDTPPPRARTWLIEELIPFVDRWFPTSGTREQRAINGVSQGGFGSFNNGFVHPDMFSSLGMTSGGTLPLPETTGAPLPAAGLAPPVPLPYTPLPGLTGRAIPEALWAPDGLPRLVPVVTMGWGDPVADQVWFRSANPSDHASNVRAWRNGRQVTHLRYFVNDTVPRRFEDLTSDRYHFDQGYETAVLPTNLYLETVFERHGIERDFLIHPGLHSGTYWDPFLRRQLEEHYARVRHHDGGGDPGPRPDRFDYRTIRTAFDIWGWSFTVDRDPVEFLDLTDVTCERLTLRGTGSVEVTVPAHCRTGVDGSRTFTVDLGHPQVTDEPAGLSSSTAYGRRTTVALSSLRSCRGDAPRCQEG